MKAIYFENHGALENLKIGDLAPPTPLPGEALIRVRASALNHLDLWVLRGWPGLKLKMPHIGGADIAGEVVSHNPLAEDRATWKEGTKVVVTPGFIPLGHEDEFTLSGRDSLSPKYQIFGESRSGGFAEYVSVPTKCLVEIPPGISFEHAAAPLLVGLTSWRMLRTRANVKAGDLVLIIGAGGGVNSFSIQLAAMLGAEVIALTSSEQKMQLAYNLGARHVLNYRQTPDWAKEVKRLSGGRGADVIVDNVGSATFAQSLQAAARGGRIVTVGNTSGPEITFDNRLVFAKQLSILGSSMGSEKDFRELLQVLWSGAISPVISEIIPLEEGIKAFAKMSQGEQFGKIVITPYSA